MRWPPDKAWTSKIKRRGFRHFVAINYGGNVEERWVNLISVLDGKVSFRVSWSEMQDPSQWRKGWHQFIDEKENTDEIIVSCRHPSPDSGLSIPILSKKIRPWFET